MTRKDQGTVTADVTKETRQHNVMGPPGLGPDPKGRASVSEPGTVRRDGRIDPRVGAGCLVSAAVPRHAGPEREGTRERRVSAVFVQVGSCSE